MFACYNLENYHGAETLPDGRTIPPKSENEIEAAIGVIKKIRPDILGVVEMGDEAMFEDFRARLRAAGLDYRHAEWVRGADPTRHLALLSCGPIVARDSLDDVAFELNGTKQRVGRGILDVTVQAGPDYRLRLVGVHLKSRRPTPSFDEQAMRSKEAWAVRRHIDRIFSSDPGANLLVFGDLNDTKNEYPIKEIVGVQGTPGYMRELPLADNHGYKWTHHWAAADIYSRIDYILANKALWPKIDLARSGIDSSKNWRKASDHRALYAAIKVPEK